MYVLGTGCLLESLSDVQTQALRYLNRGMQEYDSASQYVRALSHGRHRSIFGEADNVLPAHFLLRELLRNAATAAITTITSASPPISMYVMGS